MKRLIVALLFALPLAAQVPQCKVSQPAGNQTSYSCSLAVQAGQTLVSPFVGSVKAISDSQGNTWTIDQQTLQLSFAHATAQAGTDVVTFTMNGATALNALVLAYPASSGITVSSIANGSGPMPQSPTLSAPAGATAVAFGTQWTNSSEGPNSFPAGFSPESTGAVWVADEPALGSVSGSATYPGSVNWYAGIAVLNTAPPPPPPPTIDTVRISIAPIEICASACDGTDDTPEIGSVIIQQPGVGSQSYTLEATTGISNAPFALNASTDPLPMVFSLSDATGSLTYTVTQGVLSAAFVNGNFPVPSVRIQKTSAGIVFRGFVLP